MRLRFASVIFLLCSLSNELTAQTFYDQSSLQKIEIFFNQPNWDYQMDTAKYGKEDYIMAQSVKINGLLLDSVGVKYKGNSSFDSTAKKNPLHIELDTYKNHDYQGYKDIKLSNCFKDPSMIREVLAYDILGNYMHCPKSNFAQVYINGVYYGVYSNTESITKKFVAEHFYSSDKTFIKCNPVINPGINAKCNLKYFTTGDSTNYFNYYEIKSDYGWNYLRALCDSVTNKPSNISSILNVDRAIWMLAFNNVLVNLDSYTGAFCQNYYLYKDDNGQYNPIVWDLNMSFGGFPYIGSSNTSLGSLSIANMQTLTPTAHATDPYWPVITAVMGNPLYKRMYIAHMRTIRNEMFATNLYQTKATQLQTVIDTAVQSDTYKFFSYSQFQNAMTQNVSVGTYSVPGITTLMSSRSAYLPTTTDFSYATPTISAIASNSLYPAVNSTVTVTASISNGTTAYLGYRFAASEKFTRVLMYDDGAHNDGSAGDGIFGGMFAMLAGQAQYYIYAENANAGIFSPERAEHEFYTLGAATANPGDVVINEFLADNQSDVQNENNLYEDWIELYNNTASPRSLTGLYLSDSYSNKTKFTFPQNSIIPANGYMIIWADQGSTTSQYVHCNFKLSSGGDQIILSNSSGAVLDSVSFGPQTTDKSMGRCPDGTGTYTILPYPTFKITNCAVSVDEVAGELNSNFKIYPNPANDQVTILTDENTSVQVLNSVGQIIYQDQVKQSMTLNTSDWASGIYFVRSKGSVKKIVISH
jgi:hypothetical protein